MLNWTINIIWQCLKPFNLGKQKQYLESFNCVQTDELWLVLKMLHTNYSLKNHIYKQVLALNNPQWLIRHETRPTNHLSPPLSLSRARALFCFVLFFSILCPFLSLYYTGFNPRSSHTKDSKNGTWCLLA